MSFHVPDSSPVVLEPSEDEYDAQMATNQKPSMQDKSESEDVDSSAEQSIQEAADRDDGGGESKQYPGTRRSTRQRRAPQRLVITSSDSSKYDYVQLSPQYEDCLDSRMEDVDEEFVLGEDSESEFDTEFDTECDEEDEDDLDNKCFSDNEMEEDEEFEYLNRTAIECSDTDEDMTFSDSPGISDVDEDEESDEEETWVSQ